MRSEYDCDRKGSQTYWIRDTRRDSVDFALHRIVPLQGNSAADVLNVTDRLLLEFVRSNSVDWSHYAF